MNSTHYPSVAFITGAASGIGRATALKLATSHAVIAVDRNQEQVIQTRELIRSSGGQALGITADVTDLTSLEKAVEQGQQEFGTITATVCCAGLEVLGAVDVLSSEQWQRSLEVNLTGVFYTAQASINSLVTSKGTFTAIASDAGTQGAEGYAAYAAAKHGVVGLVRCMALDHGPSGVRSNVICPGFVETPMARRLFSESGADQEEFYQNSIPLGRFASSEEIASVVEHFTQASYANGTVYAIDGGSTAGYFTTT